MEKQRKNVMETARSLRPIDDTMFRLITSRKNVCQEILRTLLEIPNLTVKEVIPQKTETSLHREVTFDVLCELKSGKLCNIEVQKGSHNDDIKRVRFHASSITAGHTPKGASFHDVPDVKILYITDYDVLKNGQTVTLMQRCQLCSNEYIPVQDGEAIFFANTVINDMTDKSELLQLFLRKDGFSSDKFPALSNAVRYYKETEKGRETMCEAVENYARQYAENERAEGRAEGMAAGMAKGMAAGIAEGMATGRAEGEKKFSALIRSLLVSKRYDDLEKVTNDLEYRRMLYIEFNIEQ